MYVMELQRVGGVQLVGIDDHRMYAVTPPLTLTCVYDAVLLLQVRDCHFTFLTLIEPQLPSARCLAASRWPSPGLLNLWRLSPLRAAPCRAPAACQTHSSGKKQDRAFMRTLTGAASPSTRL